MEKKPAFLKRYGVFLLLAALDTALVLLVPSFGRKAVSFTWSSLLEMLSVLPPIFVLLGLLDVWVKRETMVRFLGEDSGFLGIALAYLLGSAAAGPLYAAFPVAVLLLKKGAGARNVFILVGAWSTTKIPLLLFEASSMGLRFMLARLVMDLAGIALIAYITDQSLGQKGREELLGRARDAD